VSYETKPSFEQRHFLLSAEIDRIAPLKLELERLIVPVVDKEPQNAIVALTALLTELIAGYAHVTHRQAHDILINVLLQRRGILQRRHEAPS
jgi:hypothetical protein